MKQKHFLWLLILLLLISSSSIAETATIPKVAPEIASLDELAQHVSILSAAAISTLKPYFSDKSMAYEIRYKSDECEVIGYIAVPLDYLEKNYPVLIYNRGGNGAFGQLEPDQIAYFATFGYIVLASQYRGVAGGTGTEQFGGNEVNDVLKLIDISETLAFAHPNGVYMAGHSRGGMMTYIACRKDNRIKAAAVFAGISDTVANYTERESDMKVVYHELLGGTPKKFPEEYEARSAVKWADEIDAPLLIVHGGKADWRVLTHHAEDMAAALEKYGKEYKLIIYEDADHSLQNTKYMEEMKQWFDEHPLD